MSYYFREGTTNRRDPLDILGTRYELVQYLSCVSRQTINLLIEADNISALRDLKTTLSGKVQCIYIDPPYNNQERYTYYDDATSHEAWLQSLVERLPLLWDLLRESGSLWISIDDRGMHYLKVAADRVFGIKNFITTLVWQHRTTRENRRVFSNNHEYLLVYAKNPAEFKVARNLLPLPSNVRSRYKNPDNDPRGPWQSVSLNVQAGHGTASQFYELVAPSGKRHAPPNGRCWIWSREKMQAEIAAGNVWFGRNNDGVPRRKSFLNLEAGLTPDTLWPASEVGTTDAAKKHILSLFPKAAVFDTPKPEALIARVLEIATDPGDLVLDAYLGSGTTTAVAHKLGRHYIGIEKSRQAATLAAARMKKVVQGEHGGISDKIIWKGGGSFVFLRDRQIRHSRDGLGGESCFRSKKTRPTVELLSLLTRSESHPAT